MMKKVIVTAFAMLALTGCGSEDTNPPLVVSTDPANGEKNVDPSTAQIRVEFNEVMEDGSWSWVYEDEATFPELTGDPAYIEGGRVNLLPVKLEPNKDYIIWLNSENNDEFKDASGNTLEPYKFEFRTGDAIEENEDESAQKEKDKLSFIQD